MFTLSDKSDNIFPKEYTRGDNMNKQYSVYDIDWNNNLLITLEGKTFNIDPYDMSVMVGWTPTTPIKEININGIKYIENLNTGDRVKTI